MDTEANAEPKLSQESLVAPVAVVGANGYLGRHLSNLLLEHGLPSWRVGRQSQPQHASSPQPYRSSVPSIAEAIRGAKTVVHLATSTTPAIADADPNLELENIRLTVALIDACVSERVSHLIFASSGGTIYGDTGSSPATETLTPNPSCVYAVGKLAIENLLRLATERTSLKTTVLRISNPYGGSQTLKFAQGVVSYLANQAVARKPIHLLGNTVRDYVHVDDVSVASILNAPKGHEIYNISSGIGSTLTDLCSKISEILGVSLEVCVGERRPFDLEYNVLESYKAQALLGWKPRIALAEGLRRYLSTFSGVSFP